ncbi:MAG: HlyD family secretion protein [Alteromonadaceae bacterium]|jgi:HlyD family secretion protein
MIQDTSAQDISVSAKSPWIKRAKWAFAGVAVISSLAMAYPQYQQWQKNELSIVADSLRIATVTRGTFIRDISASGKIVAANAPSVYSTASGSISLLVQPGDEVKLGQVVARLSSPQLSNQLKQQQAGLQALAIELERQKLNVRSDQLKLQQTLDLAKVSLVAAKREQRRADTSIKEQLISRIDYEKSQDDLARAELEYNHASKEAALKKDQRAFELKTKALQVKQQQLVVDDLVRQVGDLEIKAPLDGVVGNWLVAQRSQVNPNEALLRVVDLTAYEAQLSIPENFADDIGINMQTEVTVNGVSIKGYISAISPQVIDNQVSTRVRFESQGKLGLRQNQRVTARVLLENKADVLMIKRGAFLQSGGGRIAYLVNQDRSSTGTYNSARKINIKTGATSISQVEIIEGVKVGDKLIISTLDPLKQAAQVLIR